jgi:protein-tyrosine phosphatase
LSAILPELLVGEYPRVADVDWLRATHAVTAVVSLQHDTDLWDKGVDLALLEDAYRRAAIEFHRIPVEDYDEAALEAALDLGASTLAELHRAGHTVLVHCNAGYNRAPTLTIAYLCAHRGMTLEEATKLVKKSRACLPYLGVLRRRFA